MASLRRTRFSNSLLLRAGLVLAAGAASGWARGAEFRSISEAAVMYDAPAVRSKKLFVAPRGMPVEVVIANEGWMRVRDKAGDLAWVERKFLSDKRTVVASPATVAVRERADDAAKPVVTVAQDVVLDLLEGPASGWVKVRHANGATGFVRVGQVWGL